ncbi:MAG: DUF333 domain-containing protein [Proteobacteria bacterium]|jgi:hypothetical protein|nr:DUF333 domain-containing protein [Pseudomonadota bacterium]
MTATTTPWAFVGIFSFAACFACAACGTGTSGAPPPQDEARLGTFEAAPETAAGAPAPQLANPASVNCEEKGGKLEMRTEPAGQFGVCVFPDGSRCEEWRFFRDECKQGECRADDGKCEAKND